MTLPGYQIIKELSRGAFGVVYLVRRTSDGREFAAKVLINPSDANLVRFWREAKVLHAEVRNPHVVDLVEARLDHSHPFIVMEYCSGGSLRAWVGAGLPWQQIAFALSQAAHGLTGIHAARGFHRDIKPENLLLAQAAGVGIVKVGDFGLARDPAVSSGPMTNHVAGTHGYMAPELLRGEPMSAKADIFSLGITCIELLTGRRDAGALLQLGAIPERFRKLLAAMVHYDPASRPDITTVQRTLVELASTPAAAPPAAPKAQPKAEAKGGGSGWAWLLGGLATAALVGAATMNDKDANGRWRGSDGRFRSGPWG